MIKKITYKNDSQSTSIIIKKNFAKKYINEQIKNNKKIFFIIDKKVKYIIKDIYKLHKLNCLFLDGGEQIKNIYTYNNICEKLLSKKIDRKSIIIAIGGGTVGDLAGFVASTLLRGVEFNYIPTTLLSQVDSSIGGKNGINTKNGKNLIGVFYHPKEVIIDASFLKTLSYRDIKSGYAEIVKHALIKDHSFFIWLDTHYKKIFKLNQRYIEKTIYKSILIKLWFAERDPKENLANKNSRAMLNFGHTIGHAIETYYKYSKKLNHGEAISIGMIIESNIAYKLGYLSNIELNLIKEHFKKTKLKILDRSIYDKKILRIIQKDKKNFDDNINMILLKKIGESFFKKNINIALVQKLLNKI